MFISFLFGYIQLISRKSKYFEKRTKNVEKYINNLSYIMNRTILNVKYNKIYKNCKLF